MSRVRALPLFVWSLGVACAPADEAPVDPARVLPPVSELPDVAELPDLMGSFFGDDRVASAADFNGWRRDELLLLFSHYMYGEAPALEARSVTEVARAEGIDGLAVDYVELEVTLDADGARTLHVSVFLPAGARDVPAVLGPNRCGNQSVAQDERVRATTVPAEECGGATRGNQREKWPIGRITAAGFALVTFHQSELSIDDVSATDKEALSAWAKGSSLALDALEAQETGVDPTRVAVFGHSRRGKAALLASARDGRFAASIAHQSGTCGSSVLRNNLGESLLLITGVFPHWFTPELTTFVDFEERLPVDQHMLVALSAPRPVLLVDGSEDDWADPQGSLDAARAADAAWELHGDDGLVEVEGPAGFAPRTDATLVWQLRPGEHDVLESDWEIFLSFASLHLL